jgi:phenylacetate-CoA ligase
MAVYNVLHSGLFRLKDLYDGTGVYRVLARLKAEQYLPASELTALQAERLRRILIHARKHSPYYRELLEKTDLTIDESFTPADLPRIPLLTREDLQSNRDRILCEDAADCLPDSSGGSTGRPVNFYHDRNYGVYSRANGLLFLGWMGVRPGDKTAVFWGADRDLKDASRYDRLMARINRVKQLNSFAMTDELVAQFINEINRFRPRYIYGYASSLYHVAGFINRTRPLAFRPVAVRSSAEMLYDFQREAIEKAFGAGVYDFYGSREVNNIAAECSLHRGRHVFASTRLVEIVDDAGRLVEPGTSGNIAVTDLTNLYFPLIRYLNGDLASMAGTPCPCGRAYPLLDKIHGRSSDMIVVGANCIHGEYFTHLFYGRPEIAQFQLVQESERSFRLYLVPKEDRIDLEFFRGALTAKLGADVAVEIITTDRIAPGASGKHRFTISLLPRK